MSILHPLRGFLALGLAALLCTNAVVLGQFEPVVVVTVSSVDNLLTKVNHVATLAGVGHMTQMVQGMAAMYTQGLDKSRPVTIALLADDQSFQAFGVVPIADLSAWLKSSPLGTNATDLGNGAYQIQIGPRPVVVQSDGQGWTYLAQSVDDLANRPENPLELTEGLESEYDVAVRAYVQNIPVGVKDNAMAQYRSMMEMAMKRMQEANSPQAQFQQANMERQLKSVERMSAELDQFTFGLLIDSETEKIIAETKASAVRGSRLQQQIDLMKQARTRFTGFFVPKATVTMSLSSAMTPEDATERAEQIDAVRALVQTHVDGDDFEGSEKAKETILSLADDIVEIAKTAIKSGELDTAGAAMIADGKLNLVGAANASSGGKLESIVTRIGDVTKELGTDTEVRIGVGDHEGIKFHAAQFSLPESKELANAFGEKLVLVVGESPESTFFGIGDKSLGAIRKAIASSSGPPKPVQPMRFLMSVGDILEFVANVSGKEDARKLADAFRDAGTEDKILMSSSLASDGTAVTRVEVQQGVIASIGQAYSAKVAAP